MQCQFCGHELSQDGAQSVCPACEFPIHGETKGAVTVPATADLTRSQPRKAPSLRPGTVTLTKPNEVFRKRLLRLAFLFDVSGSMFGRKWKEAKKGLTRMLGSLEPLGNEQCQVGVCQFNETATIAHPLVGSSELEGALAISDADGGTNIGAALRSGGRLLVDGGPKEGTERVIVLLSDGEDTCSSLPIEEAIRQKADGMLIVTIAYGDDADHDTLRAIASSPDLFFAKGADGSELAAFLEQLGDTVTTSVQMGESLDRSLRRMR